jgi:tetratricopeptide (TPR) repeat protein
MPSKLGRFCEAIIEAGWLGALILTPLFFNVYSARVFEPDKLTLLRSIALVMIVAWLVKFVEERGWTQLREREQPFWRFPMAAPMTALALVYLITTAFSVTPRVSLLGSYQRLQGTYTTLSYLVVFALIVTTLRSKAQVERLITTAILVSVPISLYGLLQKYNLDPLPWGGDVTNRIASNMGNAIFVSAYIIMITPLVLHRIVQSFTAILTEEELKWADVVRASLYIFILALHLLAILFSQSRGPLIGFLAGTFTFVLILLVRLRDGAPSVETSRIREAVFSIGTLGVVSVAGFALVYGVGLIATNQGWISTDPASYSRVSGISPEEFRTALLGALGFVGAALGAVASIFVLAATRRGWRWLWLNWILVAGMLGGFLVLFNLPESPISEWRNLPYIGRIGTALDLESNTSQVRTYIWKGALEMITPHEPLEYPDGRQDPFNSIRPLVGYGPESMYVAYNRFYQPELAYREKRNASPDRAHNETFDAIIITGALGFLTWQAVYFSLFFLGFRWLGVIRSKLDRMLFFVLVPGLGIVAAAVFWLWLGPELVGVAFPFGEVAGLLVYLGYYALFTKPAERQPGGPNFILLTALLAATVAHFAEIHFGIAIAATRTYFFAYAALAVVIGYVLPQVRPQSAILVAESVEEASPPKHQSRRRRRRNSRSRPVVVSSQDWVKPVLVGGLIMGLMLGTLGYEFISSPQRPDAETVPTTGQIVWASLTQNPKRDFATTYATLGLVGLTALIGAGIVLSETGKQDELGAHNQDVWKALGTYLGVAILVGLVYMFFQADRLRFLSTGAGALPEESNLERVRRLADATASLLSIYYVFAFGILITAGLALMPGRESSNQSGSAAGWTTLAAGAVVALFLINTTNVDVIQADIVYKQADPWDKRAMQERNPAIWDLAIAEYNHALELAPLEDFYYLFLGRAYLEQSSVIQDPVAQQQLLEIAREQLVRARQINPLNTDHSANLARLHTRWAEVATSDVERTAKANLANEYYAEANSLSPRNAVILNEWGRLLGGLFGECEDAFAKLDQSLELDPGYGATYETKGNVALTCGDRASKDGDKEKSQAYFQQAVDTYEKQLTLSPCDLQAHTALGYAQSQLGELEEAIRTNLAGLACVGSPTSSRTFQFHRNLAILYQQTDDTESAVLHARSAAQAAGSNPSSLIDVAKILLQIGASDDAYQVAQHLGTLEIQTWNQLRDLALIMNQVGHPDEALPFAQKALELAPDNQKPGVQDLVAALQAQNSP